MEAQAIATLVSSLVSLVLQGSPYAILLGSLIVVWQKYQQALKDILGLRQMQAEQQQKLINKLLDTVTELHEDEGEENVQE